MSGNDFSLGKDALGLATVVAIVSLFFGFNVGFWSGTARELGRTVERLESQIEQLEATK